MTEIRIQEVYDTILKETKLDLVIVRNDRIYIGALFFIKEEYQVLKDVLDRITLSDEPSEREDIMAEHICLVCYALKEKHNMLAKDDKSLLTMLHWQFVNTLTSATHIDCYEYSCDTDYLKAHPKARVYLASWEQNLGLVKYEVWKSDEIATDSRLSEAGTFNHRIDALEWIEAHQPYYPGWHLRVEMIKKK